MLTNVTEYHSTGYVQRRAMVQLWRSRMDVPTVASVADVLRRTELFDRSRAVREWIRGVMWRTDKVTVVSGFLVIFP